MTVEIIRSVNGIHSRVNELKKNNKTVCLVPTMGGLVFIPSAAEMYPEAFATEVKVTAGIDILCDAHRPGHFGGVATVVTKLFLQVGADFACFGEKDYQQLFIIERLVADLDIPIEIIPAPTVKIGKN